MLKKLTKKQAEWVEKTFKTMSLDEKIGQMVNETGRFVMKKPDPVKWLKKYPLGSIFTGSEIIDSFAAQAGKTASLQKTVDAAGLRIPMLYSGDFESGIGAQIEGFTAMPRTMGLSATFSEKDSYDYGKVIGSEGRAINIRWGFGPVSDLNLNRENPVTNIRSVSDQPDHAIRILKNIVKGMQDNGCAACPKHFPGDGTDTRNQHFVTSLNLLSKEEWDRNHGRVFKELIKAGAMSIMIGHIGFPAYEPMDSRKQLWRPATCSRHLLQDLLRGELGFDGIILSDALCMVGYLSWGEYESRIIDSINAGINVFLWPDAERFFPLVKAALKDGRIALETIEDSVRRVLAFKALLGLTPEALAEEAAKKTDISALLKANGEIAQRIADKSITLLRNRENAIPLKLKKNANILVMFTPDKMPVRKNISVFTAKLKARGFRVTTIPTGEFNTFSDLLDTFDCVMMVSNANPQYGDYRSADGVVWDLIGNEKVGKLIVISFGTPYFLYDMASVPTYINAYHDCEATINAAVRAMFGEIPFKGKSPVSVPHCFSFGDGLSAADK